MFERGFWRSRCQHMLRITFHFSLCPHSLGTAVCTSHANVFNDVTFDEKTIKKRFCRNSKRRGELPRAPRIKQNKQSTSVKRVIASNRRAVSLNRNTRKSRYELACISRQADFGGASKKKPERPSPYAIASLPSALASCTTETCKVEIALNVMRF